MIQTHIVCPTHVERIALERCARSLRGRVLTCGLGHLGIARFASGDSRSLPRGTTLILVGVAGGLVEGIAVGEARWIADIVCVRRGSDSNGWEGTAADRVVLHSRTPLSDTAVTITTVREICATPEDKRRLHAATGAHLVDMESKPLSDLAVERGWNLRSVRAVSDGVEDEMPPWMSHLLAVDGSVRWGAAFHIARALPKSLHDVMLYNRRLKQCMSAVADLLRADGAIS
ncbi:MAG: hypothetical protein EXS00_01105 [Phycisphaerales bacterium]|nr:hypothetical protein [Phycisphaerales bacterium]